MGHGKKKSVLEWLLVWWDLFEGNVELTLQDCKEIALVANC